MIKGPKICFAFILCFLTLSMTAAAGSVVPYENYNYSQRDGSTVLAPQAYLPERVIYASDFGLSDLKDPTDIFCYNQDLFYILDAGSSRIIVLNQDYSLNGVFDCRFEDEGESTGIEGAKGLFVDDLYIYVADTQNARVVILDKQSGEPVKFVNAPVSEVLGDTFIFKPIRLAVDSDRLLYIVSEGTYEGILNLNWDSDFLGFFGSNRVTSTAWDLFWRSFSTKEQRKTMVQLVPQDFSSIELDSGGFFLVTTSTVQNSSMVKRLNPGGNDVIRKQSSIGIVGDPGQIWNGPLAGKSSFTDVSSGESGIYACLDFTRGKIFCYNNDGYLLYTFGTIAGQSGGFSSAAALTYLKDGHIAVLDSRNLSITVFAPTDYAKAINEGIRYQTRLDYDSAFTQWQQVLGLNANYDIAHNAVGQVYFNNGEYGLAMEEFLAASNKDMYAKAKKELRSAWISKHSYLIFGTAILLILYLVFSPIYQAVRKSRKGR